VTLELDILFVHASVTILMTGLIWFVQVVHYPLMSRIGVAEFVVYEHEHRRRTTMIVAPLMVIEVATAISIAFFATSLGVSPAWAWFALALLMVIWCSTAVLQAPLHERLSRRFNTDVWRLLVESNWIRTGVWSARSVFALLFISQAAAV
jgi:hypothetical protein